MKSDKELKEIAKNLLPIQKLFFKHDKGWMLDKLSNLTKEEYNRLKKIIKNDENTLL